jgi:glycosyltransferase involved in cell wall biosynthesis
MPLAPSLTVTIIALNEAENLPDALASVAWAREVVVIDAESRDATADIARAAGARVITRPWPGYAAQKNFADAHAHGEWVLNLDADERVTPELRQKIEAAIETPNGCVAFYVRRRNFYLGRWLRHSGWYPDYQLRLYRRGAGEWRGAYVHESFHARGSIGRLDADLLHYSVKSLAEHHERLGRYTTLAAQQLAAAGTRVSLAQLLLAPLLAFFKSYVVKRGFLDGTPGLCVAYFAAHYVFLKYAKRWESQGLRLDA